MRTLLLIVHIAAAAAWFGHKLPIPGDIRRSLSLGGDAVAAMVDRLGRAAPWGIGGALVTVGSGVALLAEAGWRASSLLGLGVMSALGAIALGATSARKAWQQLVAATAAGDLELAGAYGRRFSRSIVGENGLWLAALAAMVAG
jgi:hypothetical protein